MTDSFRCHNCRDHFDYSSTKIRITQDTTFWQFADENCEYFDFCKSCWNKISKEYNFKLRKITHDV